MIEFDTTLASSSVPWGDPLFVNCKSDFTYGYFNGIMDIAIGLLYVGNGRLSQINYPFIYRSHLCCSTSKFPFDDGPRKSLDYSTFYWHSFDAFDFEKRSVCHVILKDVVNPPIYKILQQSLRYLINPIVCC